MPKQKAPKTRKQRIEFLKNIYESMDETYGKEHTSWEDIYMGWKYVAPLKIGAMVVYKVIQILGYDISFPFLDSVIGDDMDDTIGAAASLGGDLLNVFRKACDMAGIDYEETEPEYFADDVDKIVLDMVPGEVISKINEYHKVLIEEALEYSTIICLKYYGFFSRLGKVEKEYQKYLIGLYAQDTLFMSPFYVNFYGREYNNAMEHENTLYLWYSTGTCGGTGEDVSDCHVNPARIILILLIYEIFRGI